ncbi:MAG TPA: cation transporter [Ruminococcaceae bacterium]|nr:cation transporter [Oscillospiraceae bacterium]
MIPVIIALFVCIAVLPLFVKFIERNVEIFLFIMGIVTAVVAGAMNLQNISHIFENPFLYVITAAVFFISLLFGILEKRLVLAVDFLVQHLRMRVIVFLIVVVLGLLSSIITAIIAALLLVEILSALPIGHENKVQIGIVSCFSIGLGAALTPIGEPLSTIVISKLHQNFFYLFYLLGGYCLVGILLLGLLAVVLMPANRAGKMNIKSDEVPEREREDVRSIGIRAGKIFLFVVGLDLLGLAFQPVINTYLIHWSNQLLYVVNVVSAILDNATLAAAEVSPVMSVMQIKTILISLLISGGMMVTGNIPNIIVATKMKVSMRKWAVIGLPIGAVFLAGYAVVLFLIRV